MNWRLDFHLGPVGNFIGAARRTRDYWAGSFILSRLIGEAMVVTQTYADNHRETGITLPVLARSSSPSRRSRLIGEHLQPDPMYAAIVCVHQGKPIKDGPFLGTLTNHFTARFKRKDHAVAAASQATASIGFLWKRISDSVREGLLGDFDYLAPNHAKTARLVWDGQIGTDGRAPFWEIYWAITEDSTNSPESPLDLRKFSRLSETGMFIGASNGNFCTLFPDLTDVSGIERRLARDAHHSFWSQTRSKINDLRYPGRLLDPDACLDLRPNESLSAPALVKRLLPLLIRVAPEKPMQAIGWVPDTVSAIELIYEPSKWEQLRDRIQRYLGRDELADHKVADTHVHLKRSAVDWPSTSYIAATHWVACVLQSAPDLAQRFAQQVREVGLQYARAEYSFWLPAIHDLQEVPDFAFIDGAAFHESRLQLLKSENRQAIDAAVVTLTKIRNRLRLEAHGGRPLRPPTLIGPPSSYYAIVRVDGDHMGQMLETSKPLEKAVLSQLLGDFVSQLSGATLDSKSHGRKGVVSAHNGIIIYAGADEMMALCPIDDAFELALEIREVFVSLRNAAMHRTGQASLGDLTISAAILFAHIRAPLRWAIREAETLLANVAKTASGRDSLALGLFDIDGVRSAWASPWSAPPIQAFQRILRLSRGDRPFLWSNQFYHRVADRLAPFTIPETAGGFGGAIHFIRRADRGGPLLDDAPLSRTLLRAVICEWCQADEIDVAALTDMMFALLTIHYRDRALGAGSTAIQPCAGPLCLAPLDILRVLGQHWTKISPDVTTGHLAEPT